MAEPALGSRPAFEAAADEVTGLAEPDVVVHRAEGRAALGPIARAASCKAKRRRRWLVQHGGQVEDEGLVADEFPVEGGRLLGRVGALRKLGRSNSGRNRR